MSGHKNNEKHIALSVGTPPDDYSDIDEWESIELHFHGFADLPAERNRAIESPEFSRLGRRWTLELYPGGYEHEGGLSADEGFVSAFLMHRSEGSLDLEASFSVRDAAGQQTIFFQAERSLSEENCDKSCGPLDFAKYSVLVDDLVEGALIIEIKMRAKNAKNTPVPPFVPENPIRKNVLDLFDDEKSADVVFEVCGESDQNNDARKRSKQSATFYAHRLILQNCAFSFAELSQSSGKTVPMSISGIRPCIFRHLLYYIYGGIIPEDELKTNAKEIIDAADKYGVVNLKLKAEACYAQTITLTADNVIDNLLYSDEKNCALLKEAVMDFMAAHGDDILGKVSFDRVPGSMMADLLTATTRAMKSDGINSADYNTMRVSTLRRKLHAEGLDVDGSREAMISLLKKHQ